jgi:hypothetical protein
MLPVPDFDHYHGQHLIVITSTHLLTFLRLDAILFFAIRIAKPHALMIAIELREGMRALSAGCAMRRTR